MCMMIKQREFYCVSRSVHSHFRGFECDLLQPVSSCSHFPCSIQTNKAALLSMPLLSSASQVLPLTSFELMQAPASRLCTFVEPCVWGLQPGDDPGLLCFERRRTRQLGFRCPHVNNEAWSCSQCVPSLSVRNQTGRGWKER